MIIFALIPQICVTCIRLLVKYTSSDPIYIIFIRSLVGSLLLSLLKFSHEIHIYFNRYIILRGSMQAISILCTYHSYKMLPIITITVLGQMSAIINTIVSCISGESKYHSSLIIKCIVGYIGVILCLLASDNGVIQIKSILAACLMLIGNIFAAFSLVIAKNLSNQYKEIEIELSTALTHVIIFGIIFLIKLPTIAVYMIDNIYITCIAMFVMTARISQLYFIKHRSISEYAPFDYLQIVLSSILGIIYNESIYGPYGIGIIGIFLVLLSVILK